MIPVLVIGAIAVAGFALKKAWEYQDQCDAAHAERMRQQRERESLTCRRCGELAAPISETRDRYRCSNCNHQFSGRRHSFSAF
jgi:Zn finger protein HypA/HybF involved in hydrogenase expression